MLEKLRKAMNTADIDMLLIPSQTPTVRSTRRNTQGTQALFGLYGQRRNSAHMAGGRGLWTDGRYFLQAERQLEGSGIDLFKMRSRRSHGG